MKSGSSGNRSWRGDFEVRHAQFRLLGQADNLDGLRWLLFKRRIKITTAIECRLLSHQTLATSLMAGVVIW